MSTESSFSDVQEHFAEFFGRAASLYNINPLLARLYGYLFLSPTPLTLNDLSKATGAAKSTVSVSMRTLEHYRLIRRQWQKGNRRDFFVVRTDANNVLSELFQLFFSPELKYMQDANTTARSALQSSQNSETWPNVEQREELLQRLDILDDVMALADAWLNQMMNTPLQHEAPVETIEIEVEE